MGSGQIRRLYRALPVFLYCRFKEATPKGIPYPGSHCLAPTDSSLAKRGGYVLVFIIVLCDILHSLPLSISQVNIQDEKIYNPFSASVVDFVSL